MMSRYEELPRDLQRTPKIWLVTGCAGFIGSNLLEKLLTLDQRVVGLDNFSTGKQANLDEVQSLVSSEQWARFDLIKGDICDLDICRKAVGDRSAEGTSVGRISAGANSDAPPPANAPSDGCRDLPGETNGDAVDYVLHQAALGSVPDSIEDPIRSNAINVTGFLNILVAARDAGVKRFVYAASSSTYGDHAALPTVEESIGKPLSPYAVTKYVNELYADVFARCYGLETIGLRYFNVFGPRQDPEGAYAAVIPKWIAAILNGESVYINGDGETSRDFCYVANAVQANLLAATVDDPDAINQVYNIAGGERTTLNQLFEMLVSGLSRVTDAPLTRAPVHRAPRAGDVRHSQADIQKARRALSYDPTHYVERGLEAALQWYAGSHAPRSQPLAVR